MLTGCPESKKQLFLRDLMDLMQEKMEASNIDSNETVKWPASKEERIATWHFVMLDKNKNKVFDERQFIIFLSLISIINRYVIINMKYIIIIFNVNIGITIF